MYDKFGQFIDGKWQQADKKETYDVINPATEEVIGKASKASSSDVPGQTAISKLDLSINEATPSKGNWITLVAKLEINIASQFQ